MLLDLSATAPHWLLPSSQSEAGLASACNIKAKISEWASEQVEFNDPFRNFRLFWTHALHKSQCYDIIIVIETDF